MNGGSFFWERGRSRPRARVEGNVEREGKQDANTRTWPAAPPVVHSATEHGASTASFIPWMIFLSAGQSVASTPPSWGRAPSISPWTK
jgi:hypothetical protein